MAKKFGKFLLSAALTGAAIAGGIAYLNKLQKEEDPDDDFDDFQDDFDEDLDDEEATAPASREYVTIPTESASDSDEVPEVQTSETDGASTTSENPADSLSDPADQEQSEE